MTTSLADHYLLRLAQQCRQLEHSRKVIDAQLTQMMTACIAATYRSCVDSGCGLEARIILDCWSFTEKGWEQEGVKE